MSYCQNCGREISDDSKFCNSCGSAVADNQAAIDSKKNSYDGEIHKCKNCGEILKAFEIRCPACNYELRGIKNSSAVNDLTKKLEQATSEKQRINIIKNFPIPNTKEDIFEFMDLAYSNFDASIYALHLYEDDVSDAWLAKAKQCYLKAQLTLKNEEDFLRIKNIYEELILECNAIKKNEVKKIKSKQSARKNKLIVRFCLVFVICLLSFTLFLLATDGLNFNSDAKKVGFSSNDIYKMHYEDLVNLFKSNGFTNIEVKEGTRSLYNATGIVENCTIDGKNKFYSFSKYSKDATILIYYYSNPPIIKIGITNEDAEDMQYEDLVALLENKGFINIEVRDGGKNIFQKSGKVKSISVNGEEEFTSSSIYFNDVTIVILYYR